MGSNAACEVIIIEKIYFIIQKVLTCKFLMKMNVDNIFFVKPSGHTNQY